MIVTKSGLPTNPRWRTTRPAGSFAEPDSTRRVTFSLAVIVLLGSAVWAQPPEPTLDPIMRVVDLNVGEEQQVTLANGQTITVKLLALDEHRDTVRDAVRQSTVSVQIGQETASLVSALYRLPQVVGGVQIDCPITKGYCVGDSQVNPWGLAADARFRLWPADSPLTRPGTFRYPLNQKWFASATQSCNEPCYVDGSELPRNKRIYYHYGYDFGGAEGLVEIVSATSGLVVSSGEARLPGFDDTPIAPRYDVIYVLDQRGWYYRYSHLQSIDSAIRPGQLVRIGQRLGVLGKEGGSGGWSHLHFDITFRQPSGEWGASDAFALCREAYMREYQPDLIACARPHHFALLGEKVTLDGSRSWARARITGYDWTFTDGTTASGPIHERSYDEPGVYSEVLKISDDAGNTDYDFAIVNVLDPRQLDELPPTIHATYAPTFDIQPGDEVTFKVRTFRTTDGHETWDFGDGTPKVEVKSDGNMVSLAKDGYAETHHKFKKSGIYVVRVERTDARGSTAVGHVAVSVE
ncbi:MAG: peptidoglycan DD-metalloendopeptidase family protein [Pirellulaceae bacterium]|jgi:murein DD-endopeptidase MepM/ murein hydrolase activator NlpD|nr:peptidoglycan DD-metalloendopeptidase family protein [Pirellulaceae bacterium]